VLFAARVLGGLSAGMAYPTTLALITALWSGPGRTKAIALWSARDRRSRSPRCCCSGRLSVGIVAVVLGAVLVFSCSRAGTQSASSSLPIRPRTRQRRVS
jgi:hypothetical protein